MRPDEMTAEQEEYTGIVHRAEQIARSHGYKDIITCACELYDWRTADTTLTPAEYIVTRWRLARIDELYGQRLAHARSQEERDYIADRWENATHIPERMVGA